MSQMRPPVLPGQSLGQGNSLLKIERPPGLYLRYKSKDSGLKVATQTNNRGRLGAWSFLNCAMKD